MSGIVPGEERRRDALLIYHYTHSNTHTLSLSHHTQHTHFLSHTHNTHTLTLSLTHSLTLTLSHSLILTHTLSHTHSYTHTPHTLSLTHTHTQRERERERAQLLTGHTTRTQGAVSLSTGGHVTRLARQPPNSRIITEIPRRAGQATGSSLLTVRARTTGRAVHLHRTAEGPGGTLDRLQSAQTLPPPLTADTLRLSRGVAVHASWARNRVGEREWAVGTSRAGQTLCGSHASIGCIRPFGARRRVNSARGGADEPRGTGGTAGEAGLAAVGAWRTVLQGRKPEYCNSTPTASIIASHGRANHTINMQFSGGKWRQLSAR